MRTLAHLCLAAIILLARPAAAQEALHQEQVRQAIAAARDDLVDLLWWRTESLFHEGDIARIIPVCDLVIQLDPSFVEPYAVSAWLSWDQRPQEAAARYQAGIAANPKDYQLQHELGLFYSLRRRDQAAALPHFRQAASLPGAPPYVQRSYARCLTKLGRRQEAIAAWKRVLDREPNDPIARRELERLSAGGR